VARITPGGALLEGSATTGAGVLVTSGNGPVVGRFGAGSLVVWGHQLQGDAFSTGLAGNRFTADGKLLDAPGDSGGRWFLDNASAYALVGIPWGGDRALLVWAGGNMQTGLALSSAVAFPW
jgi:hypothetical protein